MPLTPEEQAQKEKERREREQSMLSELDEMDGLDASPSGSEPAPASATAEPAEPVAEPASPEVKDERVAEAGPEDHEPEPAEPVAPTAAVADPAETEDEYDFSFINDLARAAIAKRTGAEPQPTTQTQATPEAQPQPAPQQPTSSPRQIVVPTPTDLVSKEEMEAAFESPEKMMEVMGKIYTKAVMQGAEIALQQLPGVMQPLITQQQTIVEEATKFYKENPELVPYRDFVQFVAMEVEDKHPDWNYQQVMAETATVAKKRLPMLQQATTKARRETRPAFAQQGPGGKANRPKPAQVSALQSDIDAMPDVW